MDVKCGEKFGILVVTAVDHCCEDEILGGYVWRLKSSWELPEISIRSCGGRMSCLQYFSITFHSFNADVQFNKLLERLRKNQEANEIIGTVLLLVNHIDQIPAVTGFLHKHGLKSQTAGDLAKPSPLSRFEYLI